MDLQRHLSWIWMKNSLIDAAGDGLGIPEKDISRIFEHSCCIDKRPVKKFRRYRLRLSHC